MVSTAESPAEISSLAPMRLPELSVTTRSWEIVPPLTRKKTTLPWVTEMVDGSNLYSVRVTLVEPAGCPPLLPPQAARRKIATRPIENALPQLAVRITQSIQPVGTQGRPSRGRPCAVP